MLYAGLMAVAFACGPALGRLLDMSWSAKDAALIGFALLALPALAPCVLWLLLSIEGRVWRKSAL